MHNYKHILFDLDGTVIDSGSGIMRSAQYALKRFGIDAELSELHCFIGPPLAESFKVFYNMSDAEAERAVSYYRELYRDNAMYDCTVYDGITELLEKLKNSGHEVIIATSKPTVFARPILERLGLDRHIDYIFGCELDGRRAKKDEVLRYALECHPIDLAHSIMVGDRLHDMQGAKAVGLTAVGILWGYGDRDELVSNGAAFIAENTAELESILLK